MDNITTKNVSDSPELNAEHQSEERTPIYIKEEPRDEIKDYAETTMNELLSWYGYDKVSSQDTEKINFERYTNSGEGDDQLSPVDDASRDDASIDSCDSSSGRSDLSRFELSRSNSESSLAAQHRNLVTALTKKHGLTGVPEGTLPSGYIVCAWCQKPGVKLFTLKTSTTTKAFCSEVCFTQCRRASFKKNKICDWCKHVRHTVNYVDFQDGETQLQFCGSKCLNQYKMNIFCKETQEHLQQIQSPKDTASGKKSPEKQILITPDLWLKHGKENAKLKETKESNDSSKEESVSAMIQNLTNKEVKSEHKKIVSSSPHNYTESDKLPATNRSISDRINRDRSRRSLLREPTNSSSATPVDLPGMSSDYPNAGLASMAHVVPPHMWGAFGFGMSPFGAVPPWYYPGFMPPGLPGMTPAGMGVENTSRIQNRLNTSIGGRLTADNDSDSSSGTPSARINTPRQTNTAGNGVNVRTETPRNSSNNPFFPGFPGMNLPPYLPGGHNGMSSSEGSNIGLPGVPPVTMIMPVPVPLPLPVPIPLPLPLTMEKIMEVYNKSNAKSSDVKPKSNKHSYTRRSPEAISHIHNITESSRLLKGDINENDTDAREFLSCMSCSSDRSESVNSCPEPSPTISESRPLSRGCFSESQKRSLTPQFDGSLDLTKRARLDESFSDSCDGAIDLSNSGNLKNKSYTARENGDHNDSDASANDTETVNGEFPLKVPKIHIISPRPDPPLSQHLPLPPVDPKYSSRRGLILDAPSVPKKQRSPSPDRRSYARTVPRDVMEAARRRCLRARIRTK